MLDVQHWKEKPKLYVFAFKLRRSILGFRTVFTKYKQEVDPRCLRCDEGHDLFNTFVNCPDTRRSLEHSALTTRLMTGKVERS